MRKKIWGAIVISAVGVICLNWGIYSALAETSSIHYSANYNAEYTRGINIEIPNATLTVEGESYEMDHSLIYPDNRTSNYDVCYLDMSGKYQVDYSKEVNGKTYKESKSFYVIDAFSSLFSYGENIELDASTALPDYISLDTYTGAQEGLKFHFKENKAELTYNGIIDLRELGFKANTDYYTRTESTGALFDYTNKEFIELMVTPEDNSAKELDNIKIKLTDIYDENNFMTINLDAGDRTYGASQGAYVTASAQDMYTPIGRGNEDEGYTKNGALTYSSFYGKFGQWNPYSFKFFMDPESSALWGFPITGAFFERFIMHEFDNAAVVGYGNEWHGFTTGEVKLSIVVDELLADQCSIMIMSVGGKKLSSNYSEGDTKILVDYGDFKENNLPYAVKGESYPIFDTIAYNTVGGIQQGVQAKVFFGDTRERVYVDNGRFLTEKAGDYYIEYSIKNYYGVASKTIKIHALDDYEDADKLNYFLEPYSENVRINQKVTIPSGSVIGGVGDVTVKTEVFKDNVPVEIITSGNIQRFVSAQSGTYTVKYTLTDMLGKEFVKSIDLNAVYDTLPYLEKVSIPSKVIKGREIIFPIANTEFITSSGNQAVNLKITVNGEDYTNKKYTVTSNFTVMYQAILVADGSKITQESYDVQAVDFADIEAMPEQEKEEKESKAQAFISKYFNLNGFAISPKDTNTVFSAAGDASFDFINPIYFDLFSLSLSPDKNACDYGSIDVYLTDSVNLNETIKLSIQKKVNQGVAYPVFALNDVLMGQMAGSFDGTSTAPFSLSYRKFDKGILDANNTLLANLTTFMNGDEFTGFSSGYVYLTVKVLGVNGNVNLGLNSICNQIFSNKTYNDTGRPQASFDREIPTTTFAEKDGTFTTPVATFYDVLGSITNPKVVVKVGVEEVYQGLASEPHTFTFDKVGQYVVTYTCDDDSGKKATATLRIFVEEFNAPQITVDGKYDNTYKVNEKISILNFTVEDDSDKNPYSIVFIETPSYAQVVVEVGAEYTFTEKGYYKINYYARDGYYNGIIYSIGINVVE